MFKQIMITNHSKTIPFEEKSDAVRSAFQFKYKFETIHNQMSEIKKNLRESIKSIGIDEKTFL